jgi:DNA-binding HxlR family transcriptional regulator
MSKINQNAAFCAVDYAFQRIGGKYKARILWYLHEHKVLRYGELKRMVKGITTKMLTQTLRELEKDELVTRKEYHQVPPKVEYSLTSIAEEFVPFIDQMRVWAEKRIKDSLQDVETIECH